MMIKMKLSILVFSLIFVQSIAGQRPTTTTSTTSIPTTMYDQWTDPHDGGKYNNPGANIHLSGKALDQLHAFVVDRLTHRLQSMNTSDLHVPLSDGYALLIKSPRVVESKFAKYEKQMLPPNRIGSRFFDGRLVFEGEWEYKGSKTVRLFGRSSMMTGTFKATIVDVQLETVVQLTRTNENKPIAQVVECRANLSHFRVDVKGAGDLTLIENCDGPTCVRIRKHAEDVVCNEFRLLIKEIINANLATFPSMIELYPNEFNINYGLLYNEPKVTDFDIQAGLESKAVWYGQSYSPFYPQSLDFFNRSRMIAFELSDFAFNHLLHQPHAKNYKYSAAELLSKSPSINDALLLNCSAQSQLKTRTRHYSTRKNVAILGANIGKSCLGAVFQNMTNSEQQQQEWTSSNDTGDFVYKSTNRAPSIVVFGKDRAYFDGSNGVLELYGPAIGANRERKLLAKADIRSMQGEFMPRLDKTNITGSIKITKLELSQASWQTRSIGDDWLIKLEEFAKPMLTEMFNAFFERYARFPVPMLDGFECSKPEFWIAARTMQVDCDITGSGKFNICGDDGSSECPY